MRLIITLLLCNMLAGCWFVYIPGSWIEAATGGGGNICVGEGAKVGDRIRLPTGGYGTLTSVNGGISTRCQNPNPTHPYLATVKPE